MPTSTNAADEMAGSVCADLFRVNSVYLIPS